jgi:hypothetical protein
MRAKPFPLSNFRLIPFGTIRPASRTDGGSLRTPGTDDFTDRRTDRFVVTDPHKAVVDALWDRLPESVHAAVAAMVQAAAK